MDAVLSFIYTLWNQILYALVNIRIFDVLDIVVIAFLVYKAIEFLRENRAGQLVKGIIILLVAYLLAIWWKLALLRWVLTVVMDSAIIIIAVVFQPELRRILEKLGRTRFSRSGQMLDEESERLSQCIDNVCKAAATMQERKVGALIVFERDTQLGEIINTGTLIDAVASVAMTSNLFFPYSPLHDGALIIRSGRLYAAGCILPLTQSQEISSRLGTRHRAGIGMTENSDAVVLIVSEETGIISIVVDGQIKRNFNSVSACAELRRLLIDAEKQTSENVVVSAFRRLTPRKKRADEAGKDGK